MTQPLSDLFEGALVDVAVSGSSLALLLEAALDSGGDIAGLETGRLSE